MKALVTGATGFLGSNLARRLVQRGWSVRALVRNPAKLSRLAGCEVEIARGDLCDARSLRRALHGVDAVFNCAARVADWGTREEFYRANVQGTQDLAAASAAAGVKRFVHASSLMVLGLFRDGTTLHESSPYTHPHGNYYTETKIAAEKLLLTWYKTENFPAVIVRPGIIWGPGDTTFLPRIEGLERKGLLRFIGRGDNNLCLSYISHVVDAFILAAELPGAAGRVFHVTDDEDISSRRFFAELAKAVGLNPPRRRVAFAAAYAFAVACEAWWKLFRCHGPPLMSRHGLALFAGDAVYDISATRRRLGYEPALSFQQAMETVARWHESTKRKR